MDFLIPKKRVYFVKKLQASASDSPKIFLVITEPIGAKLRLKTWFDTNDDYIERHIRQRGMRIWEIEK